jgi:predicted DCC family thiol-disulfide oxidoreductase YuxK
MTDNAQTRVLYNADCPVCSYEIDHYARYAACRALPVRFEDLNEGDLAGWGLTRDAAARRLHVLKDGTLHAGIPAFLVLWRDMPRYAWLARVVGAPGVRQAAEFAYDRLLAPVIYRWPLRRVSRAAAAREAR